MFRRVFAMLSLLLIEVQQVCGTQTIKTRIGTRNVYVSMPYDMRMYIANVIYIQTNYGPLRFQLFTQPHLSGMRISSEKIYQTETEDNMWHTARIPYHVPFYDAKPALDANHKLFIVILFCKEQYGCRDEDKYELQMRYTINPYSLIILGESEKLLYEHGETLKARFRVLNAKQSMPSVDNLVLPKYRKYKETLFRKRYIRTDKIPNPFSPEFKCTYLRLHGADGLIWFEKKDVPAVGPINFNFLFETATPYGVWMLELRCLNQKKTMSFQLRSKTRSQFYTYLVPPDNVYADSGRMEFKVCVRQHGGTFMHADVEIMVCVCEGNPQWHFPLNQIETDRFWERQACAINYHLEIRRCEVRKSRLRKPCAMFEFSTVTFSFHHINVGDSRENLYVCHRVTTYQSHPSVVVSKCDFTQTLKERGARLILDDRTSYHPDLPFTVTARLVHPGLKTLGKQMVLLEISQLPVACDQMKYPTDRREELIQYYTQMAKFTEASGEVSFIVPPVRKTPFLQMHVVIPFLDKNKLWHQQIAALDYTLLDEKTLKPWASYSGVRMQVWGSKTGKLKVNCRLNRILIELIANRPLHMKTIWAEGMVSGEHKILRFDPNASDPSARCRDRDDIFGHFTCVSADSDQIKCLPGWTGKDCLDPICARGCHPAGGWCKRPGECICKRTWTGTHCQRCISCLPSQCSFFAYYPCLCEYPVAQYTCSNLEIIRNRSNTEQPRRTIYHRKIHLNVSYQFLSGTKFVFYFYETLNDGTVERIATNADIQTTGCLSPALHFSELIQHRVEKSGAENVDLFTIRLPVQTIDANESEHCHIRTGMLNEHPGQVSQIINRKRYMHFVEHVWGNRWLYRAPLDTSEAFQSAGLLSTHLGLSTKLNLKSACPHMSVYRKDGTDLSQLYMRQAQSQVQYFNSWERLYDAEFYEPQWIFETVSETERDSEFSYFRFSSEVRNQISAVKLFAYCMTSNLGLWIGETAFIHPNRGLTVRFDGPLVVVIEEVPYFQFIAQLQRGFSCGQAKISVRGLSSQVTDVSSSNMTFCICPEQVFRFHFAKRIRSRNSVNLTTEVELWSTKTLCSKEQMKNQPAENSNSDNIVAKFEFISTVRVLQRFDPTRVRMQAFVCDSIDDNATVAISARDQTNSLIESAFGPIQVTSSCSLNWFWTSLTRLQKRELNSVQSAEELALHLISLSGHIRFLMMNSVKAVDELRGHYDPIIKKIRVILDALRRLQRTDYSMANFNSGDLEGSVWLSALVLRAVKSVANLVGVENNDRLYLIKDYLLSKQRAIDGCFHETGNMPYSGHGESGRLSKRYDHIMLTSYVLLSLQPYILESTGENKITTRYDSNEVEVRRRAILCLKTVSITYDDMELSNYAWALLTYTMSRDPMAPMEIQSINIRRLLLNVKIAFPPDETSLPMVYLEDNSEMRNPSREMNALALEATAYMYLSLPENRVSYIKKLHIIKYLVTKSDWEFTSHPTQSSTMVFEALVHFAMENTDKEWFEREYVSCTSRLLPSGQEITKVLRDSERFIPVPTKPVRLNSVYLNIIEWTVTNLIPNQCALSSIEFTYSSSFISAYNKRESPLAILIYETNREICTSPELTICVFSEKDGNRKIWGTFVLEIWPPLSYSLPSSGSDFWRVYNQSKANRGKPRQIVLGGSGEVLIQFEGWSTEAIHERSNPMTRCVSLRLQQVYYAEFPQPLKVKAYDLHRLYPETRAIYQLPDCRPWIVLDNRVAGEVQPYRPVNHVPCPICSHIDQNQTLVARELESAVCNSQGDMAVFESIEGNFHFGKPVIMYTTRLTQMSTYWLTTVSLGPRNCTCKLSSTTKHVFAFTNVQFDYSVSDPEFTFLVSGYTKTIHLVECGMFSQSVVALIELISQSKQASKCTQALFGLRILLNNIVNK